MVLFPAGDAPDKDQNQSVHRHTATKWLDGLRGSAALIVVLHHFGLAFWSQTVYAYGTQLPIGFTLDRRPYLPYATPSGQHDLRITSDAQDNSSFLQLPVIRLWTAGDAMVAIFFIVSGYSLSIKPISLINKGADGNAKFLTVLSSAAFRRPIRLFLPVMISTLIVAITSGLGLYRFAAAHTKGPYSEVRQYFHGWVIEPVPPQEDTFMAQMNDWFGSLTTSFMTFATYSDTTHSQYDRHTWTIPVEFACSYLLYITQAALALLGARARLLLLAVFITTALIVKDSWEMALFWSGMALCEYDALPTSSIRFAEKSRVARAWTVAMAKHLALFVGAYLASMPGFQHEFTPLYAFLDHIRVPGTRPFSHRFWVAIGSLIMVTVISRTGYLKRLFSSRPAKYLGRISFSLYLVHGPVLRGLGYSLAMVLWQRLGIESAWRYNMALFVTVLVTFVAIFALSHIFCIAVDEPVVRLTRWTQDRATQLWRPRVWEPVLTEDVDESPRQLVDSPCADYELFSIAEKDEEIDGPERV